MSLQKFYFSTGEFAKVCNISKDTLFHYEKKGILSPQIIKENGYRYYSTEQFDLVSVIVTLRKLGMSIEQIKQFLDNRNEENLLNLFTQKEKEIGEQIESLKKIKHFLKMKKQNINEIKQNEYFKIYQQDMKEEQIIISEQRIKPDDKSTTKIIAELISRFNELYEYELIGGIRMKDTLKAGDFESYNNFYIKISKYVKGDLHIKEKGRYLVLYHKGNFEKVDTSYKIILDYIDQNNIKTYDEFYEDVVIDHLAVLSYDLKIMVRIKE